MLERDADLNLARQDLQRNLDIFGDEKQNSRLFALGLKNFYLQMADPSLGELEEATKYLAGMSGNQINQLHLAGYETGDNTKEFFSKRGVEVDDVETIWTGISNSEELISHFYDRFDHQTGEPYQILPNWF